MDNRKLMNKILDGLLGKKKESKKWEVTDMTTVDKQLLIATPTDGGAVIMHGCNDLMFTPEGIDDYIHILLEVRKYLKEHC